MEIRRKRMITTKMRLSKKEKKKKDTDERKRA